MIEVLHAGSATTVQDLGRPGLAHLGVGRSGAADRRSLALANRLVGNPEGAAALEVVLGGLALRAEVPLLVAVTGAPAPVQVRGQPASAHAPVEVATGEVVELGTPARGVRTYVAVRGGVDVPRVLGSRSTDTLAGLGPPPLRAGDRLPVGPAPEDLPRLDVAPVPDLSGEPVLAVLPGPRDDWFAPEAMARLLREPYEVSPDADRVGLRLRGPALPRTRRGELPSEGMVEGALQVSPDGAPTLFLADHPVTGGYPVIAVVDEPDVPVAAQLRPGQRVRFRLAHGR